MLIDRRSLFKWRVEQFQDKWVQIASFDTSGEAIAVMKTLPRARVMYRKQVIMTNAPRRKPNA